MRVLVIGAGAIGTFIGSKLAQAGQSVTLVGRPTFAGEVAEQGLRLQDERGSHVIHNINAVGSIAEAFALPDTVFDIAILTVKSYDTTTAIQELCAALQGQPPPSVLSMQNGVGNEATLATFIGGDKVIAGTLTTPVSVVGPGAVVVDRPSYYVGISAWQPTDSTVLVDATHHTLEQAGFDVRTYSNAVGMKWTKLLLNIVGNATSAILDMPAPESFADARVRAIESAAWREAFAVMAASHITPINLGSYPIQLFSYFSLICPPQLLGYLLHNRVSTARGAKMPSLHIDLQRGRTQSEISWLNGAIVNAGVACKVPTPINRMLTETVTHLAHHPAERAAWRHNIERLAATAAEYRHR